MERFALPRVLGIGTVVGGLALLVAGCASPRSNHADSIDLNASAPLAAHPKNVFADKSFTKIDAQLVATLRTQLRARRQAGQEGNIKNFTALTPAFLVRRHTNLMISMMKSSEYTPESLKHESGQIEEMWGDFASGQVVGFKKTGATAVVVFAGNNQGEVASYGFQEFFLEEGQWKPGMFYIQPGRRGEKIQTPHDLKFYETLPKPGDVYPRPDRSAILSVTSYGYKVSVTVNGIRQDVHGGESESGILLGGLKHGKNKVSCKFSKAKGWDASSNYELTVEAVDPGEGRTPKRVLSVNGKKPGSLKRVITIPWK
jgi:hypothetical protein